MFCANCGEKLLEHMIFCPQCGERIICPNERGLNKNEFCSAVIPTHINKVKQTTDFNVLNHNITLADSRVNYNKIRKTFCELADSCVHTFGELYKKNLSLKDVIRNAPQDALEAMQPAVDECIRYLISNDFYTIDADMFYDRYIYPQEKWSDAFQTISDKYAEIILDKEQQAIYRKKCRENRGRWVGGGFGVQGAVKGAITAGAMNMVEGAGYAILNGISGIISSVATDSKLDKIFKDSNTFYTLAEGVYDTVYAMHISLLNCIYEGTGDASLLEGSISDKATQTALVIMNNLPLISDVSKKEVALVEIFQLDPYLEEWYAYVYNEFGDVNGELERLALYFNISIISELKEKKIEEYYNKVNIETEDDAIKVKEQVIKLQNQLCYIGDSKIISTIESALEEFDIEARTVDGMLFETREEAELNRFELSHYIEMLKSVDEQSLKSLEEVYTELGKYSGKLAIAYKNKLENQIENLDLAMRTVRIPIKNKSDIVFSTIVEAEYAQAFTNILFGLLDEKPNELYKRLAYYDAVEKAVENDSRIYKFSSIYGVFKDELTLLIDESERRIENSLTEIHMYYDALHVKTKERVYILEQLKNNPKIINNAYNSYLKKLGCSENEKVLMIYDNTVLRTGEKGFTITNRGFYSTGCSFNTGKHFISRDEILTSDIKIKGSDLIIGEKYTDIVQTAWLTREKIKYIVKKLLYDFPINSSPLQQKIIENKLNKCGSI